MFLSGLLTSLGTIIFTDKVVDACKEPDYKLSIMMNIASQILSRRSLSGMFVCLWAITYAPSARNGPR